jgi:non-ribosomal peptide synthetase-like protein
VTTSDLSDVRIVNETEAILVEVLAEVVGAAQVRPDDDFFDDLGADSMLMARFCARLRKRGDVPPVSMKDVYHHPTVRTLAVMLDGAAPAVEASVEPSVEPAARVTGPQYVFCGALQLLFFLGYTYTAAVVAAGGYEWISHASGWIATYLRIVVFGGVTFLGLCTLPILAKWVLVGRWTTQEIPIWSLAYVRFWIVKTLVRTNPLALFAGSPLYVLYLRALGANVGRGVTILSPTVPVCTDLLTIGDGTVVRKDSLFSCYRGYAGVIQTGPVTIGREAVVGEVTVLDIHTSLGDGAQLGHSSALHPGQSVPAGERWHGSPAQRTEVDYRTVEPTDCSTRRRVLYSVAQSLKLLVLELPLAVGGLGVLLVRLPHLNVFVASLVLFFGSLLVGLAVVVTVPRLLNLALQPGKVYPLYGFHYGVHRAITRMTNITFFMMIFGDSSYVVHYLRSIGYRLSPVVQTGSNFGVVVKHETPFLSSIGRGTMVADGLSLMNADFSSTSFRLSPVSIGPNNFVGNNITYPAQGRTGDNCLLGTKAMIPIDGEVREHIGLLGSPCFEIPRSVLRDGRFDHLATGEEFHRRLAAKNRYNLRTMAIYLFAMWLLFFAATVIAVTGGRFYGRFGPTAIAAASLLIVVTRLIYFPLLERLATKFRPLRPRYCSIYEPYFWYHERYWKLCADPRVVALLNGTPFKGLWWRLAGVRIGRRVFDDGSWAVERSLTTIGDDCTLNAWSEIQCHSQEDGAFKSDRTILGAGCTIGVGALVHYGVTMGDGAVLEVDSFLMKGEEVPSGARWGGNPARELR